MKNEDIISRLTLKNIIRILVLTPLSVYLVYCLFIFITRDRFPTYRDCGKIVSKANDEVAIKRGVITQLYLNIEFEKTGFRSTLCNPTTYFSSKVGDTICFDLNQPINIFQEVCFILGAFVLAAICLLALASLIMYLL